MWRGGEGWRMWRGGVKDAEGGLMDVERRADGCGEEG